MQIALPRLFSAGWKPSRAGRFVDGKRGLPATPCARGRCAALASREVRRTLRSSDFRAVIFLALAPFVIYFPAALGLQTFFAYDIQYLFYPIRFELAHRLAQGQLPFWSATMHGGFPLLAEGQVGALYPLNWLLYRFLPLHIALSYSLLPHLALAGVGMYLFLRTQNLRAAAASVGALSFYFSGFFAAKIQHMTNMIAAGWMPWLFFCYEKFAHARDKRARRAWFAAISVVAALMLLNGHLQIDFIAVTLFGLWVLFASLRRVEHSIRQRIAEIGLTMCALVLGVGIAAAQLIPFAELFPYSIRGGDYAAKEWASYSLNPERLIQVVSPFAIEGPFDPNVEFFGYVGLMPLGLAIAALAMRRDRRVWFWVAIIIGALALAIGSYNPFYELLFNVPVFNRFRVPARFLLWFIFAMAFLAALALDELARRLEATDRARRAATGIAIAFGILIVAAFLAAYNATWEFWLDAWHFLPYIFGALAAGILISAALKKISAPDFLALTLGLTVFDLTCFVAPFLFTTSRMVPPEALNPLPRSVAAMENANTFYRVLAFRNIHTSEAAARASLQPTLPTVYSKEGFDNYIGLPLGRNNTYHETMSPAMFNLANIRYYLVPIEPPADPVFLGKKLLPASEPAYALNLDLLSRTLRIPPTRAMQIEVVSYTDDTANWESGFSVGEIELGLDGGSSIKLPLRLGFETADWAY
ncbi:MAG: YfhO family protein, partial [Chloroflexi bacterium]|nr:YfhO family protein [Chloroflexota bacterium]